MVLNKFNSGWLRCCSRKYPKLIGKIHPMNSLMLLDIIGLQWLLHPWNYVRLCSGKNKNCNLSSLYHVLLLELRVSTFPRATFNSRNWRELTVPWVECVGEWIKSSFSHSRGKKKKKEEIFHSRSHFWQIYDWLLFQHALTPDSSNTAARSVALSLKLWRPTYPSSISFACEGLCVICWDFRIRKRSFVFV